MPIVTHGFGKNPAIKTVTKFVCGVGRRKSIHQKQYQEMQEYLERLKTYASHIEICGIQYFIMPVKLENNQWKIATMRQIFQPELLLNKDYSFHEEYFPIAVQMMN